MKKTNIGNIEIIIDPEPDVIIDHNTFRIHDYYEERLDVKINTNIDTTITKSIIKEPGRARNIYNKLRRFLK